LCGILYLAGLEDVKGDSGMTEPAPGTSTF